MTKMFPALNHISHDFIWMKISTHCQVSGVTVKKNLSITAEEICDKDIE